MDQIKFRSAHYNFDGTFNGFSYWGAIDRFGNIETTSKGFASPTSRSGTERKFEEQYSSLKDKNGVEIYEGDIYSMIGRYFKVIFENGAFCVTSVKNHNPTTLGWKPENEDDCCVDNFSSKITIIGNIHENPELLK